MVLSDIIIQKIKGTGPLSFHDFMDMSLYYPEAGYYTSESNRIGKNGDYYTSANITEAFGAMIGRQLEEMWRLLGGGEFTIVEYGAGTGYLCHDILDYLEQNDELYSKLRYCIIEKSMQMCEKQRKHLPDKVTWHDSILELPPITGCILSNELLDNFPVHSVIMKDKLMEVFVDYDNTFTEVLKPAGDELNTYLSDLKISLPRDYRTEINLDVIPWINEIARSLKNGYILTIDYGYTTAELYQEHRSQGTLVCYHKHTTNYCPYINIGEQDITSHVNFSAIAHWGVKNDITVSGYTNQSNFLHALGFVNYISSLEKANKQGNHSLLHSTFIIRHFLMEMGNKFKVLIQRKGDTPERLQGLMIADVI